MLIPDEFCGKQRAKKWLRRFREELCAVLRTANHVDCPEIGALAGEDEHLRRTLPEAVVAADHAARYLSEIDLGDDCAPF